MHPFHWDGKYTVRIALSVVIVIIIAVIIFNPEDRLRGVQHTNLITTEIDLGDQPWNAPVPFSLTLANNMLKDLLIKEVGTSCDCLLIEASRYQGMTIKAGAPLTIDGVLHTQLAAGAQTRRVTISCSEGDQLEAEIHINVIPTYSVEPAMLDFGRIAMDSRNSRISQFIIFRSDSCTLLKVTSDSAWLTVTLSPRDDSTTTIHIDLIPELLTYGRQIGSLTVHTDDTYVPSLNVLVGAQGLQYMRPDPPYLILRDTSPQLIRFFSPDNQPVPIQESHTSSPLIDSWIDEAGNLWIRARHLTKESTPSIVRTIDRDGHAGTFQVALLPIPEISNEKTE